MLSLLGVGCAKENGDSDGSVNATAVSPAVDSAAETITADALLQHIKDLSADSMEGRGPGTPGEERAVAYLQAQFKAIGLKPGNPDGSYIQNADLIGRASCRERV